MAAEVRIPDDRHEAIANAVLAQFPGVDPMHVKEGWSITSDRGGVLLEIGLVKRITRAEAEAILNANPDPKGEQ